MKKSGKKWERKTINKNNKKQQPTTGINFFKLYYKHSPRWLIARDQYSQALAILAQIRGNKTDDTEVQMEYTSIVQDVTFDRTYTSKTFFALFKTGIENYRKRTVLGAGIHIFTQLTGANGLL